MIRCSFIPPRFIRIVFAGSLVFAGTSTGHAQADQIKLYSESKSVQGTVESITKDEIVVNTSTGSKTIPASDIESINFAGADALPLRKVQLALNKGDYKEAVDLIDALKPGDFNRDVVRAELAYLNALVPAKVALSGQTDSDNSSDQSDPTATAKEAGKDMLKFLAANPNTYHYYEANEIVGDLLMSIGQYDSARNYYKKLAESPAAELKARADLLRGRAMQVEGKYDAALEAYDSVLKANLSGKLGEQETIEARVGRTYSLASSGKTDEGVKILQNIIAKADDDDSELLARAYDALGNCYRKLKDNKQALWAYLRVDTLYRTVPEAHAEALANLVVLWGEAKRPDRAREARDYLQQHYPFSRWNKQIK